jgi:hypothetical protein
MTVKELEKVKRDATNIAVKITHLFPLWVLRTKFGFGEKRLRRFMAEYADLLDSFNKDYVSLPDIAQQLEKETGIRLDEEEKHE